MLLLAPPCEFLPAAAFRELASQELHIEAASIEGCSDIVPLPFPQHRVSIVGTEAQGWELCN